MGARPAGSLTLVLVFAVTAPGCGGDDAPDDIPPEVVSSAPAVGDVRVAVLSELTVIVSEPLNPATVTAATVRLDSEDFYGGTEGEVWFDEETLAIRFRAVRGLGWGDSYTL